MTEYSDESNKQYCKECASLQNMYYALGRYTAEQRFANCLTCKLKKYKELR